MKTKQTLEPNEETTDLSPHDREPSVLKTVVEYLDLAIEAAAAQDIGTGELLGLFSYYTHGIASDARERALDARVAREPSG